MFGVLAKTALRSLADLPCRFLRAMRGYKSLEAVRRMESPKILLVACHWIGDTLWAAQVVPHLRDLWPKAQIHAIVKPITRPLWTGILAVDALIDGSFVVSDRRRERVDWGAIFRFARGLRGRYDLVIDLTGTRYSAWFCHGLGAQHTLGFGGDEFGALYATWIRDAERPGRHLSERPFRVIEPLHGRFAYEGVVHPPRPCEDYEKVCVRFGLNPSEPLIAIAPGAAWSAKEWGEENFRIVCQEVVGRGKQVVLLDRPLARSRLERIAQNTPPGRLAIVAEPSLDAAISFLSGCRGVVGNDSGLAHLAAAFGRTTIVIFTEETEPSRCTPIGEKVTILRKRQVTPDQVVAILMEL